MKIFESKRVISQISTIIQMNTGTIPKINLIEKDLKFKLLKNSYGNEKRSDLKRFYAKVV